MQDKAIAAIGEWQLKKNKDFEPVDLYIENMFPGKDYQLLVLVFEIKEENGHLECIYKGIDIEKVSTQKSDYRKYAYRKGASSGGDITFTTKLSNPVDKKINTLIKHTFKKVLAMKKQFPKSTGYFQLIESCFINSEFEIKESLNTLFTNFDKKTIYFYWINF